MARSSLNLRGSDPREGLELIKGSGALHESLACFRMLAQIMGLPFRRDALEKTIRDALRRGKQPNLPMLGQLVAGMGLNACGAKIPPTLCTRINVPCLMAWENGFGVVVQSNASGMLMAHPRLGWVGVPEKMVESAPDGFEVIWLIAPVQPRSEIQFRMYQPQDVIDQPVAGARFIICGAAVHTGQPLLIQVIIDKVISQRSLDTLPVLGIALVVVTIFEEFSGAYEPFCSQIQPTASICDWVQK